MRKIWFVAYAAFYRLFLIKLATNFLVITEVLLFTICYYLLLTVHCHDKKLVFPCHSSFLESTVVKIRIHNRKCYYILLLWNLVLIF